MLCAAGTKIIAMIEAALLLRVRSYRITIIHPSYIILEAFYKDRKMKRTQRYLYVALIVIILILITVFCMYRKYPDLVKQLFGKCCKQVSSNFSTGARYNQHGAHMPIMDQALR